MRMPQLVVFDLGRVLIRLADSREQAADQAGVVLPVLDAGQWQQWEGLRDQHELGQHTFDTFAVELGAITRLSVDQHRALYEAWLQGPMPGVDALLDELCPRVATACLSNTNDLHWALMHDDASPHRLPLERLTHRFASHLLKLMKPDEAIYAHVEQAVGLPGEAILFFDDHPPNIDAAQARGWQAHRIEPDRPAVAQMRQHLETAGLL